MSVAAERAELAVGGLDAGLLAPTHWPRSSLPGRMHGSAAGPVTSVRQPPLRPAVSRARARSKRPFDGGENKPAGVVLFAVAGIAALFCNIASSAGFALIVPDRRQLW